MWRIFGNRFGALILGTILLIVVFSQAGSSKALCGGVEMRPGQECEETSKGGSTHVYSYDEMKNKQTTSRYLFMAAGFILVLGGGTAIVVKAVRRNNAKTAAGPGPVPPPAYPGLQQTSTQ